MPNLPATLQRLYDMLIGTKHDVDMNAHINLLRSQDNGVNADLLDNCHGYQFTRRDIDQTVDGNIIFNKNVTVKGNVQLGDQGSDSITIYGDVYVKNDSNTSNTVTIDNNTGIITSSVYTSTVANGTSPLNVTSTTRVNNLNADMVDGYHVGNNTGQIPINNDTVNTNLNADKVDGYHANIDSTPNTVVVRNNDSSVKSSYFISTATSGQPLQVSSTALVTSLNSDLHDGYHASITTQPSTTVVRDANGDINVNKINCTNVTCSQNVTINGSLFVNGNAVIGDSTSDELTINSKVTFTQPILAQSTTTFSGSADHVVIYPGSGTCRVALVIPQGTPSHSHVYIDFDSLTYNVDTNTLTTTNFNGTATRAKYADLAEMYTIQNHESIQVGTVVSVSEESEFECEVCNEVCSSKVIGVVSEKPAFLMNSHQENSVPVALKGKVKCKIIGPVKKGDVLVSWKNGCACSVEYAEENGYKMDITTVIIGKSLETNNNTYEKLCIIVI